MKIEFTKINYISYIAYWRILISRFISRRIVPFLTYSKIGFIRKVHSIKSKIVMSAKNKLIRV